MSMAVRHFRSHYSQWRPQALFSYLNYWMSGYHMGLVDLWPTCALLDWQLEARWDLLERLKQH